MCRGKGRGGRRDRLIDKVLTTVAPFTELLVTVHCVTHDVQSQNHSTLLTLQTHAVLYSA